VLSKVPNTKLLLVCNNQIIVVGPRGHSRILMIHITRDGGSGGAVGGGAILAA
jgi:hypothetical protein